jgi:hypothetical protein
MVVRLSKSSLSLNEPVNNQNCQMTIKYRTVRYLNGHCTTVKKRLTLKRFTLRLECNKSIIIDLCLCQNRLTFSTLCARSLVLFLTLVEAEFRRLASKLLTSEARGFKCTSTLKSKKQKQHLGTRNQFKEHLSVTSSK